LSRSLAPGKTAAMDGTLNGELRDLMASVLRIERSEGHFAIDRHDLIRAASDPLEAAESLD
jgi:hypothetical protein